MDKSIATKIVEKFGFTVEPSHYTKNLFFFINWFLKIIKIPFYMLYRKNNWFLGERLTYNL